MWFLQQLNPGLPAYNEVEAVRLLGEVNVDAFEWALNVIVERHDALRTTIQIRDNQAVAVVHDSWPIQLKQIDLCDLSPQDREAEVKRLKIDEPRQLFRLETQPGIRASLLRLGVQEYIFILVMHHIICDWHSVGVLWRELAALYCASSRGEPQVLEPLTIQPRDYACRLAEQTSEARFTKDLAFWERNLLGSPRLLELPADRTRPAKPSYCGARRRLFLNQVLTRALRDLSRSSGVTLFTVFAAALNALLYRYTGQEDILVGIPISDRDRKELQAVIGFLLHTQVLRTELSGDMTFRSLLARVQGRVLKLQLHRAVPFDRVVRRLHPDRDMSYSPLFQVMLSWRHRDHLPSFLGLEGLVVKPDFAETGAAKFDMTLFVTDCGDDIWLEIEYCTELFDEERIARMLSHFQTFLEAAADDPDRHIEQLPLMTSAEYHQTLVEWNGTDTPYASNRLLHDLVEEQVGREPDAVAVVFEDKQLTYRQLSDHANRLAQRLQSLGVGPNVLVGICVERSLEMLVGLLGILKAGGAYVPLDPAYPQDRLAFMLEDCQPRVLVIQKRLQAQIPRHPTRVIWLDAPFEDAPGNVNPPQLRNNSQPSDLAYVLYTSGTTGRPKGVQVSHQGLVNLLSAMQREPGLNAGDTLLAITTLSFDISGLELFLPLIGGARVVIASRETAVDGARLSSLMNRCGATVMQATPATWRLLLDAGWTGSPGLKILCGGEAWTPALATELLSRCESLWNMYGPTETTVWSSVARVERGKPILIGHPIANTTFYVLDGGQVPVPVGVPGELYIGGDGLAHGYLKRPDLTNERFVNDPFSSRTGAKLYRTGDLVRRRPDGQIEFLRRIDQQVKIRGFRIELEEVEAALKQHAGVGGCIALVQEDLSRDKRLAAYVVPNDGNDMPPVSELRNFLKEKLPDYMIPTTFVAVESLPLTPNGKIDRKALSGSVRLPESKSVRTVIPPRTSEEVGLVDIWEQILGIKIESVRDSFFDLGGHSLLAVRLFAQIEKDFKLRLPLATLYEAPTIEDIAQILKTQVVPSKWRSLVPIQSSGGRPPFFCFHGAGGNVLIYRKLSQYLGSGQPVYGLQAQGLDGNFPLPNTIEEMAALYVREIRDVQSHGPYLLGGYCMGGTIAYEAAQQLQAAGEEIALLALFDTSNWHEVRFTTWNRASWALQRLVFHAAALLELDSEGKHKFLEEKFAELRNRIAVWRGKLLPKLDPDAEPSSVLLTRIWSTNHKASCSYIPRPYSGAVTDFRPSQQYRFLNKPGLKWERLAERGQHVVLVPGYPAVMLIEPFVKDLARSLKASIDAAICCGESSPTAEEGLAVSRDAMVASSAYELVTDTGFGRAFGKDREMRS
jgi:amino acid adenylation domain-containing protein